MRKDLIAASKKVEEIREFIGADSLHYLSLEGLYQSLANVKYDHMCYACFNCDYPAGKPCEQETTGNKYIFETRG